MKRSLSSLITDTNVREYEVKEININIIMVHSIPGLLKYLILSECVEKPAVDIVVKE